MSFLTTIGKSLIRGKAVRELVKGGIKGLKSVGGRLTKGLKQGGVRATRGVKSASAQVRALPTAVSEGLGFIKTLPPNFGTGNTIQVFKNVVSRDLAKASKTALAKDSAERLSARLAKVLGKEQQREALQTIFRNARANETWLNYSTRNLGKVPTWVKGFIREGGENIVIDQTASAIAKGLGAVATAGTTGAVTGAVVAKKNKK